MGNNNVGIITVHTGFNYGTSLQAYAIKELVASLGYNPKLYWYQDSFVNGRDVRINKIIVILIRTIWRPKLFKKVLLTYKKSTALHINTKIKDEFYNFTKNYLNINNLKYGQLKTISKSDDYIAFVCGSDQIWNATNIYVDPIFYLRFSPKAKRIAYAPSFGKSQIPNYNRKIISKYISDIDYISVREEQGARIVNELISKDVPVVLDPTLVMSKEFWNSRIKSSTEKSINGKYILFYFLDKPNEEVIKKLKEVISIINLPVLALPFKFDVFNDVCSNVSYIDAGPLGFVELVSNATFVCTDSFHGTAFCININTPFYVFKRNYGVATEQSSRITSILKILNLENRLLSKEKEINKENIMLSFNESNALLAKEREKSRNYLLVALKSVESHTNERQSANNE